MQVKTITFGMACPSKMDTGKDNNDHYGYELYQRLEM